MSKTKFPNTTRRRLSSSVVCRLSSSGAAFFFPRFFFFHDPSLHSDKRPPKQGPYSCCSRPMIGLRGLWLGALRGPWPVQPMKTRGLWPMTTLKGLWPGVVTPLGSTYRLSSARQKRCPRHGIADQPLSAEFLALRIAPPTVGCSFHAYQGIKRGARWAHFMPTLVTPLAPNSCV